MASFKSRRTDQSFPAPEHEDFGSQSPRQGQYLSRTLRPRWTNPVQAQRPLEPLTAHEPLGEIRAVPETATFHHDLPPSRVSKHLADYELEQTPSRLVGAWDGVVTQVGSETFKARVIPLGMRGPEQAIEFSVADVSDSDMELFEPGAIFYWTIAYRTTPHGRVRRASEVRFRRLPTPPRRDDDDHWVSDAMALFDE